MNHTRIIAALCTLCLAFSASASEQAQDVLITFKEESTAPGAVVLLRDIAEVECLSPVQQSSWEKLDLDEGQEGDVQTIHRERVQLRARLAGLDPERVRWRGASSCNVTFHTEPNKDSVVLEALTKSVAISLNLAPEDLKVTLTSPVDWRKQESKNARADSVRIEAILSDQPRPGSNSARLALLVDEQLIETTTCHWQLGLFEYVPRAARAMPRGETLTRDDFLVERILRVVPGTSAAPEDFVGQTTATAIAAGQVIRERDVRRDSVKREFVIQGRQPVRVIVRKGNLEARLTGAESMEPGRVGDWIRVRNPQSNRIVRGRVSEDQTVILE